MATPPADGATAHADLPRRAEPSGRPTHGLSGQSRLDFGQPLRRHFLDGNLLRPTVGQLLPYQTASFRVAGEMQSARPAIAVIDASLGPQALRPDRMQLMAESGQLLVGIGGHAAIARRQDARPGPGGLLPRRGSVDEAHLRRRKFEEAGVHRLREFGLFSQSCNQESSDSGGEVPLAIPLDDEVASVQGTNETTGLQAPTQSRI